MRLIIFHETSVRVEQNKHNLQESSHKTKASFFSLPSRKTIAILSRVHVGHHTSRKFKITMHTITWQI